MATIGFGSIVTFSTDTSSTASIGKIINVSVSGMSKDEIDVSSADSTSMIKEKVSGMVDPGKATFTMRFNPASSANIATVKAAFDSTSATHLMATIGASGAKIHGSGFVSELNPVDTSYDGDATFSFTFTFTESPTITTAA